MPYTIETATSADAEGMAALHFLSHTVSFAPFVPPEWVAGRRLDNYRAQWQRHLESQDARSRAWVARVEGRTVGMVRISPLPEEGVAQLTSMHVHPEVQGRGIGGALMNLAEAFIREAGYGRAVLGVIEANVKARRLYERSGWKVLERHETGVEGVPSLVCGKEFIAA